MSEDTPYARSHPILRYTLFRTATEFSVGYISK